MIGQKTLILASDWSFDLDGRPELAPVAVLAGKLLARRSEFAIFLPELTHLRKWLPLQEDVRIESSNFRLRMPSLLVYKTTIENNYYKFFLTVNTAMME